MWQRTSRERFSKPTKSLWSGRIMLQWAGRATVTDLNQARASMVGLFTVWGKFALSAKRQAQAQDGEAFQIQHFGFEAETNAGYQYLYVAETTGDGVEKDEALSAAYSFAYQLDGTTVVLTMRQTFVYRCFHLEGSKFMFALRSWRNHKVSNLI